MPPTVKIPRRSAYASVFLGVLLGADWRGWRTAPTGLVPGERGFVHQRVACPGARPTGLAPGERGFPQQRERSAKPPHWCTSPRSTGASPVGAEKGGDPPFLCRSLHSTGASPVGAQAFAPPGPARWGHKPSLHRGQPVVFNDTRTT